MNDRAKRKGTSFDKKQVSSLLWSNNQPIVRNIPTEM